MKETEKLLNMLGFLDKPETVEEAKKTLKKDPLRATAIEFEACINGIASLLLTKNICTQEELTTFIEEHRQAAWDRAAQQLLDEYTEDKETKDA